MMGFDPLWFMIVGPAILLALYAQVRVKSAFRAMSRVPSSRGMSGAEAARAVLLRAGISDVPVERSSGWLSDHYDPAKKVLRLSEEVYAGRSLASIGVAAHEAGHALQHAQSYGPLMLRSYLVPTASIGSWMAFPMIFLGGALGFLGLVQLGIALFALLVVFQIVTLPVEFNASSRARAVLADSGIVVDAEEMDGVRRVLNAAAMTYVAATVQAVAQLLYFLLRSGLLGGSRDD